MSKTRDLANLADLNFDSGTLVVDKDNDRVGVGTSSPDYLTQIEDTSGDANLSIKAGASSYAQILLGDAGNAAIGRLRYNNADNSLQTVVNGGVATTIDSIGNLLVGTTDAYLYDNNSNTSSDNGVNLRSDGKIDIARYNGAPLGLNMTGNDGTIVDIRKSGSPVGIIGVGNASSYTYIGTGDTGLMFNSGGDFIQPWNPSTNGSKPSGINLGNANNRFKDLYLSGGVSFGDAGSSGTSSSNHLDSYEEGTWEPIYRASSGSFTSITYDTITDGYYTRIGDKCFIEGRIRTDALTLGTASGYLTISGLPFTGNGSIASVNVGYIDNFSSNSPRAGYLSGSFIFLIGFPTATGDSANTLCTDLGTSTNNNYIYFSTHYRCS